MKSNSEGANFYSIINNYHTDFQSIKNAFSVSHYLFWLALFVIPVILYLGYAGLIDLIEKKDNVGFFYKMGFVGALWFVLALMVANRKFEVIKRRLQESFNTDSKCLVEITKMWLKKHFPNHEPKDYLDIAKKIDSIISLRDKYDKVERNTINNMFRKYVLPEDAKSRITSALLALSAVVVALSIKADISIYTIFEQFEETNASSLLGLYVMTVIALFVAGGIVVSVVKTVYYLVVSVLEVANSSTTFSKRRAENFINTLLWHYNEPGITESQKQEKPRIRVCCEMKNSLTA